MIRAGCNDDSLPTLVHLFIHKKLIDYKSDTSAKTFCITWLHCQGWTMYGRLKSTNRFRDVTLPISSFVALEMFSGCQWIAKCPDDNQMQRYSTFLTIQLAEVRIMLIAYARLTTGG